MTSYLWSNGAVTQSITVTTAGSYSITVTDSNGCTAASTPTAVTVAALPAATITASGPTSVCTGGSVTLSAPAGMSSYSWSDGSSTQSITVTTGGTYSATVTSSAGCTAGASQTVTVTPAPTATISTSGPTTFCDGGSVTLTANGGAAGASWLWSNGETTQAISAKITGSYTVTITNAGGCSATSAPVTVTTNPLPQVTITGPTSICGTGQPVTLTATGSNISSYFWSNGATTPSITVTPSGTASYGVTATSSQGCTASANHVVSTSGSTAVAILAPGSVTSSSTGNTASIPGGASGSITWMISNGTITGGQGTSTVTFTAGANGAVDILVTVVGSAACAGTGSASVAIISCATSPAALIAPADGATGLTSPVAFSWTAVTGATLYEVWITTTGSAPQSIGATASTSLTLPVPSGTISWTVFARLPQGCSPQILMPATRAMTVVQGPDCTGKAAPAPVSPVAGQHVFSPVTFRWNPATGASGYRVMATIGNTPPQELGITTETTFVAIVEPAAITWWVEAMYSGCPAVPSQTISFVVEREDCAKHSATRVVAPAFNATLPSSAAVFEWTPVEGADGYRVWVGVDGADARSFGETVGAVTLAATLPAGRMEWFVETLFEGCPSTFSEHSFFNVPAAAACATTVPDLTAPAQDAAVSVPSVTFQWSAVASALEYELWLSVAGGSPTLVGRTTQTSLTREVPRGDIEWFVRALINGCPSRDSLVRRFRYQPPPQCGTERPLLLLPLDDARGIASPVSFRWTAVDGAVQYRVMLAKGAATPTVIATVTVPSSNGITVANGDARWFVEAVFGGSCPSTRSTESRFVVFPAPRSCTELAAPVLAVPGQISSDVTYTVRWSSVPGAEAYVLREWTSASLGTATQLTGLEKTFTHQNSRTAPFIYYYRVEALDQDCTPAAAGASSVTIGVAILPARASEASSQAGAQSSVSHILPIGAAFAGQSFTATPNRPWITVSPSSGVVGAGGIDLVVTTDVTGLPVGTSVGAVSIALSTASSSRKATNGTTTSSSPVTINLVTPVTPTPKSTPPPDALIIPAVAHADGINSRFQSDVRVTNTSPQVMKYQLTFTPSGEAGMADGRQTTIDIEPGRTIALDDVLKTFFGTGPSNSAIGTLEIRPLTQASSSTSSATVRGISNFVTFASSRTFNITSNGTYGTYIAAIPFANFIGRSNDSSRPTVLSLQQIAQSSAYRTNVGFVEGTGNPASLLVSVFNAAGSKLTAIPIELTGGQHLQIGSFLQQRNIQLEDGRIEVRVTSPAGKVTAYASVINNVTNDSLVVTPVSLSEAGSSRFVLPGVAELSAGVPWQSDVRIFNAGSEPVAATLTLQSLSGQQAGETTLQLAPGEVRVLDRALSTLFGTSNDGGALHIVTQRNANLIATARTYRPDGSGGNFGQFIQAVTPNEAIALGSRPLQILQVEESARFRSNIGLAEVSGRPVKVEITVIPPDSKVSASLEVDLAANQFRQLGSLLGAMGLSETHNARVTVKVMSGQGRVTAYAATIDSLTQDPTFVPAQ
ncbi:MAG: hypothetical protein ABIO78_03155 [Thermoanaerobaculia bacterium]